MPTWGCEGACEVGIKPCFHSSGYFHKRLSSSVLVVQALLCTTTFKTHVHKGKPGISAESRPCAQPMNWMQTRFGASRKQLPWSLPPDLSKVHLSVFLGLTFKGAGLWKGRIPWEADTEDDKELVVKASSKGQTARSQHHIKLRARPKEGSEERLCLKPSGCPQGLVSCPAPRACSSVPCVKSYWII